MLAPQRRMFRETAVKHYMQKRHVKDVLPRLLPVPIAIFLWILLGSFLVVGVLAWSTQVPIYVTAPGIVLDQQGALRFNSREPVAIIFLPEAQSTQVRVGLSVQLQIASSGQQLGSKIAQIEPGIASPDVVSQRYKLNGTGLITGPSVVVLVRLGTALSTDTYAGSVLTAHVWVGSRRVLSLLPGVGNLVGE
jgi:hypothetical protein